jgi:Leucine-rich repeat (LRR) protein
MIEWQYVTQLTLLPSLVDLDLSYNELEELPESLNNFTKLKKLNLEGNKFRSDHKAAFFWSSLASLPCI